MSHRTYRLTNGARDARCVAEGAPVRHMSYGAIAAVFQCVWMTQLLLLQPPCTASGWTCWQLGSLADLVLLVQRVYYVVGFVGHWLPEMKRQLFVTTTTALHGLLWLNASFVIARAPLPKVLARLDAPTLRLYHPYEGTWAPLWPLLAFYCYLYIERTFLMLAYNDERVKLEAHAPRWRLAATTAAILYQLFAPVIPLALWVWWYRPAGPVPWSPVATVSTLARVSLGFILVNGAFLAVATTYGSMYISPTFWVDYYRAGYLVVRRPHKGIVMALVE